GGETQQHAALLVGTMGVPALLIIAVTQRHAALLVRKMGVATRGPAFLPFLRRLEPCSPHTFTNLFRIREHGGSMAAGKKVGPLDARAIGYLQQRQFESSSSNTRISPAVGCSGAGYHDRTTAFLWANRVAKASDKSALPDESLVTIRTFRPSSE
ncbi:hypothetical protein MAR_027874, partial [Mya arenaria]